MLSSTLMLAAAPLQYLTGAGSRAYPVVALTWAVLIISILVIICIGILLSAALVRSRGRATIQTPPNRGHDELPWIYVGVTITVAILFATSVWTVVTLAQVATPPADQTGSRNNHRCPSMVVGDSIPRRGPGADLRDRE